MNRTAIKNATVVNEGKIFRATVFICGETIQTIDYQQNKSTEGYQIIDATGQYLLPGIIDNHVHFRDPGLTHKADFSTESRAAVAGGVTSVMEMPNTLPITTTNALVEEKCNMAAQKSLCNYSFYLGATNDNLNEILSSDPQKICGVKVFMGSSTGNMLVDQPQTLETIFKESPLRIVTHCEDETIIRHNTQHIKTLFGEEPSFLVHPLIRSEEACYQSTAKAIALAEKYGSRLHVAHLTTERETKLFRNDIPLEEKRITSEACVQHLWFCDDDYHRLGGKIKCNPAIKTKNDRESLREALRNHRLDLIATDHAPHTISEKNCSYYQCPSGIPMIQHSLTAMMELVSQGAFTIETLVEKMCHHPSILFHIENRGFIREGYFADLVLVHPHQPQTVSSKNILYKCGWSPFEGITFSSKVTHTFVNGNLVWHHGVFDETHLGQRLFFQK